MHVMKSAVMALLACNTALTMLLTDNALQIKGLDVYYSQFETRCNAMVAGVPLFRNYLLPFSLFYLNRQ